jgi:hypothetical protein
MKLWRVYIGVGKYYISIHYYNKLKRFYLQFNIECSGHISREV